MKMQQQQQLNDVRPISTYDNLNANASKQQQQQQQQQLNAGESSGQSMSVINAPHQSRYNNESSHLHCDFPTNPTHTYELLSGEPGAAAELNETSNSIAAVKAALSDAKSKFFGLNSHESHEAESEPLTLTKPAAIKAQPKYQNVPPNARIAQLAEAANMQLMQTTITTTTPAAAATAAAAATITKTPSPDKSLRYGYATYEQIPLSDLDAPQSSQAVYMSTTVPQNIKGMKIAGRHTPTRNSLRHSRMIVVNNKHQDSIQDAYSTHIRQLNMSRQLLILQLAIGLLIVGLAIWVLILAPNASILINPYLSGLSLLLASISGLILLGRDRRSDQQRSQNNCYRVLLAESYVFSALALIFCCLALVCAAIEFAELSNTATLTSGDGAGCGPATSSLLSYRNCTCLTSSEQPDTTADELVAEIEASSSSSSGSDSAESCESLRGEWKYLLGCSMALNTLGIIATFLYITIFICCQRSSRKHFNTSV
ncbi:uncharacterized protein LOC108605712 isoform X2 [Drosophila busckii]|nr:uncharacterized protein LOC108605712 isoform X2 [Drosophila busckii]